MLTDTEESEWENEKAIWEGDALFRAKDLEWPISSDFNSGKLIILIHGFTAHGRYMLTLGRYLQRNGFDVLLYNYNSYKGIESIASTLEGYLQSFEDSSKGSVTGNGFFIVAHSLGGLVARQLALYEWLTPVIKGIVLLGTPNDGCFPDERVLNYMIQYGQHISDLMLMTTAASKTAKELIKKDGPRTFFLLSKLGLIDRLNDAWKKHKSPPPLITVSGGKRHLIISNNPRLNWAANHVIQKAMRNEPNDGLVHEKSVDLRMTVYPNGNSVYTHSNSYPDYPNINHSNLKENLRIALDVITWINSR